MDELIAAWESRWSRYLAIAEEAFFAGDERRQYHFETCARQWRFAIDELKVSMPEQAE